ncbi:major facilitator superfamily domain-containing protein [Lentinula edodes]|nr:major facilitator superfamily domain-containing protein [Lentinula edodes]
MEQSEQGSDNPRQRTVTPLPKIQVFIVILMQLTEPISATVIFPFINQLVLSTGVTNGDEKKSGYYAGIIESVFFFSESLTTMLWGHASDRYGRRTILLLGPLGLAVVTSLFGLSSKYWTLILFRSLQGVFNGNLGVSKTVLAELSDATNMATAFSFTSVMWQVGVTIGTSLGGILSNPAEHWPKSTLGKAPLLRSHPYLLPCLATGFISFSIFIVAFIGLKETHAGHDPNSSKVSPCAASVTLKRTKSPTVKSNRWMSLSNYWTRAGQKANSEDQASLIASAENMSVSYDSMTRPFTRPRSTSEDTLVAIEDFQTKNADSQRIITFRTLLTSEDVLRPLSSLALLSFLETSISVLIPITYTTSIANGGLGLTATQLGTLLSVGGAMGLIFSAIGVPLLIRHFGVWKMHFAGMSALIVGFSSIMMACLTAKRAGYASKTTWIFVAIQYASYIILPLGFSEIPLFFWNYAWKMLSIFAPATSQMFVVNGAPNRDALGTTNGMVQSARTLARTVAPVCVMSLFSISKEYNIVHGQLSYVVCLLITICGLRNILELPRELNRL